MEKDLEASKKTAVDVIIKKHGEIFEMTGLKELFGRLFGLLMIETEPISLTEIAEKLGCSKPAASTILSMGRRANYFQKTYKPQYPREDFWYFDINTIENLDDPIIKSFSRAVESMKINALHILEDAGAANSDDPESKHLFLRIKFYVQMYETILGEMELMYDNVKNQIKQMREELKKEGMI